jgi:hypothetical protein
MSIWIVPLDLPCAQCGGAMKKGTIAVRPPAWFIGSVLFRDNVFYVGPDGEKVKIVGSSRTELAYRCAKCGTVLITHPGTVGRKARPSDKVA